MKGKCRGKGDECHLNVLAELRSTNRAAATMINNGLLLALSESGRSELSAWGLALDSNRPDLTYHEGQLSRSAKLMDTGLQLAPMVGAVVSGSIGKAVASKNPALQPKGSSIGRPSAVDGEMAGGNRPTYTILGKQALLEHAERPFKNQSLTNAGRAATKHPQYFGFNNTSEMRSVYRSDKELNNLAKENIKEILSYGKRTTGAGGRYPDGWITYTLPDGRAASWTKSGEFIGFRGWKK